MIAFKIALLVLLSASLHAKKLTQEFNTLLDKVAFEANSISERLHGYKKLISYTHNHEVHPKQIARLMSALETSYRVRDLNNRDMLLQLQEIFAGLLRIENFSPHQGAIKQYLERLQCDLKPFAIKSGDFVTIEFAGTNRYCATHKADTTVFLEAVPLEGKQIRMDCLFKVLGKEDGKAIAFGEEVQLQPLYIEQNGYLLPPSEKINFASNQESGKRGAESFDLTLQPNGNLLFTCTALTGEAITGMPVVAKQELYLTNNELHISWALAPNSTRLSARNKILGNGSPLALHVVKPQVVAKAHQKLIKANTALALKAPTLDAQAKAFSQILSSVKEGIDTAIAQEQSAALRKFYEQKKQFTPEGLRQLTKLFACAAKHPAFEDNKLVFEQYVSEVGDELKTKAIAFDQLFSLQIPQLHAGLQLTIDPLLAPQGHVVVAPTATISSEFMGQQCLALSSPSQKKGAISYGDELVLSSYFVDDGKDGGLLACPVTWWLDILPDKTTKRLLASSSAAIQTRNGQQIFVIQAANNPQQQGPVLPGDTIQLFSKHAQEVVVFGKDGLHACCEIKTASQEELKQLAHKKFTLYVKQAIAERDMQHKTAALDTALDLFKGQKILPHDAGKILFAAIKKTMTRPTNELAVAAFHKVLAKAQEAPFSEAAKRKFVAWATDIEKNKQ